MIRLSKSCLDEREYLAVKKVLQNEYLGMGKDVKLFEDKLSKLFKRDVVCVSSGTAALQLSIQSLNLNKNDEILVQSLTYLSSYQAISANGIKPIPCDIDLTTGTINVEDARSKINERTKAIMPVHYAGNVGRLNEIYLLAKEFNLRVIEDAAHAFGSYNNKKIIGQEGDLVCFSFDGIKNITSGEGGCVVSSDTKIINKIRDLRLLGISGESKLRNVEKREWKPIVNDQGWRYHMSNIMASIGIVQLSKLKTFSIKKRKLLKIYLDEISKIKNVEPLNYNLENVLPHIFVIKILSLGYRDKVKEFLAQNNIETGLHYFPNHKLDLYKEINHINLENTNKFLVKS